MLTSKMARNSTFCIDSWRIDGKIYYSKNPSTDVLDIIDVILGLAMVVLNTILFVAFSPCRKPNTENAVDKSNIHSIRILLDFLLNLSVICIITGIILILNGFMNIFIDERFFLCENGTLCVVKHCVAFGIFLSTTFNVLMINVERFINLIKPMLHHKLKERALVRTMVVCLTWVVVVLLSCIPLIAYNHQTKLTHCTFSETVGGYYLILLTLIFLATSAASFSVSAYGIITAQTHLSWLHKYTANPKQVYKTEWSLAMSLTSVIASCVFVTSWLPVIIYGLHQCGQSGTCQVLKDTVAHNNTQHVLLLISMALSPSLIWVIYFWRCPVFRTMLKESLTKAPSVDKPVIKTVISSVHDNRGFIDDNGAVGVSNHNSSHKSTRLTNSGNGRLQNPLDVIEEAVDEDH